MRLPLLFAALACTLTCVPPLPAAFVAGVATLLNVAKPAVVIISVTNAPVASGRHLLQSGGVLVTFTVTSSQSMAALTAAMTNGALTSALAASFANAGLAAPTVIGSVSVTAAAPAVPSYASAKYNNKNDLGALDILVVLPVAAFGFYWVSAPEMAIAACLHVLTQARIHSASAQFSPMRKRHFPPRDSKMDEPARVSYGSAVAAPVFSAEEAPAGAV